MPIRPTDRRTSPNHGRRIEPVIWPCVHYSAGGYEGTVSWVCADESEVAYHRVLGPDGQVCDPVPWSRAAWSVGSAKTARSFDPRLPWRSPNSSSENVCLAGGPPKPPTAKQVALLVETLVERMRAHGWGAADVYRIKGHEDVAVTPNGKLGRKDDPTGRAWQRKMRAAGKHVPVWLDLDAVRAAVAERLGGAGAKAA